MSELTRILATLAAAPGQPAVLATLVSVEGSSYRRPGARLLLLPDGTRTGSVSGGCLEEDVMDRARRVLASGQPELARYDTTAENDLVWGTGLGCQGVVQVFLERLPAERPAWIDTLAANQRDRRATTLAVQYVASAPTGTRLASPGEERPTGLFVETVPAAIALVICGAGDDAQPLARLADDLGWHVTVADTRAAYATPARFPAARAVLQAPAADLVKQLRPDDRTYVVVLTHRFADDVAFLRALLPQSFPYLGLLGPRSRTNRLMAALQDDGYIPAEKHLAKLHAPVGLALGSRAPETIALAIAAEIQARLAGVPPGFLRDQAGPIHGG